MSGKLGCGSWDARRGSWAVGRGPQASLTIGRLADGPIASGALHPRNDVRVSPVAAGDSGAPSHAFQAWITFNMVPPTVAVGLQDCFDSKGGRWPPLLAVSQ